MPIFEGVAAGMGCSGSTSYWRLGIFSDAFFFFFYSHGAACLTVIKSGFLGCRYDQRELFLYSLDL